MTTRRFKQLFFISSLTGILIAVGGRSAQAESLQMTPQPHQSTETVTNAETVPAPDPAATSATPLQAAPEAAQTPAPSAEPAGINPAATVPAITVAQDVDPGRATRSGSSYIGIGGNIGFGGDSGLGTGNFAVISKVGLTRNLSLRPGAIVGDGATFLLPATVDFPIVTSVDVDEDRIGLAPFIGGGVAIATDDDSEVQPLVTAGVDVPISSQFTANATANVSFPDDVEVGIILGIGYNFR